ncbi:TlpA family protein disulfide reductase [Singulisphaera acidiphila]|nr:TlpA disulfide reductase family protein [Singulisphaera acidiphila]
MIVCVVAIGSTTAIGAVGLANSGADDSKLAVQDESKRPGPPLAERLDRLKAEYEDAFRAYNAFFRGSTIPEANKAKAAEIWPDLPAVVRRIADQAAIAPKDPAVRDAWLWVIEQIRPFRDGGPYAGEFVVAANWLVLHFGDDPDAVRVGLEFANQLTASRDFLLLNFYASAKGRESKGLARLALAKYLERKAVQVEQARKIEGRPARIRSKPVNTDGPLNGKNAVMPAVEYAYFLHLKQCDAGYLRAEAQRLYEEVIAQYDDVPYITASDRLTEALLRQPEPKWNGQILTAEERRRIENAIARRRRSTLGQEAEARLDDWHNLAVGKPAPEINGVDVHGKSLALSDYRGKVVAIVFWGTWCGPCMQEIPREKALVERMKGRPFAVLGVNTDADAVVARKTIEAEGITWPNWHDRMPGLEKNEVLSIEGPISKLYRVRTYPTVYLIDAEGKIRSKGLRGDALDQLVETLVAEQEADNG